MPTQKFPIYRATIAFLSTAIALVLSPVANGASVNCGNWTVNVKGGTYDQGDVVWWKSSVTFTHQWGTYTNNSGSTSPLGNLSCMVNSDNDTCSVTLKKNGDEKQCESPTLRLDTTPPACGNWTISTSGYSNQTWTPGQDVTFLDWYWAPSGRSFRVSITDAQSGVPSPTVSYSWPSDSLADPSMQSTLGDFARVNVTDNAGNVTECVWPRKRVDGFEPSMPTLDCDNFISGTRPLSNPYQGQVKCGLSDNAGPSRTYVYYRVKTYLANVTTGAIGALETDTNWVANGSGSFDTLIDVNGNRIRTGAAYDLNSTPLRYAFTPKDQRIVKVQGRLCEFQGTSANRCVDSNTFEIIKLPAPPPIPETAGDGWYKCQNANTWKIIWYSPDETIPGTNQTLVFMCSPDGVGAGEPRSKAEKSGNMDPAGSEGCWCWDNESPTISSITANPTTWTNQPVSFVGTAGNIGTGGSPYGGIQYSCDNGATWSAGTTSTTATFDCDTVSASAQTAKVRACDQAKNCSATIGASFYIEKTAPTVSSLSITGKKKNWNGHTNTGIETDSTQHTYKKDVSIALSPADSGGSGLASVRFSCNPTFQNSGWENWTGWAGTKAFDLTDTWYGCNATQGNKTVYVWAKDKAGNVSPAASASITYDKTPPTFDVYSSPILLKAIANYTYSAQNPSDGAGSGLKDYSYTWIAEPGSSSNFFNLASPSNDFGNLARYVNGSCDVNDDGKCIATIRITVEDKAGNATTQEQRIEVISSTIAAITGDTTLTSSRPVSSMVADLYDRYTYTIHLEDANGNVIRPVPGILEIRGDWSFANDASFLWNEKATPDGNVTDGAVWYNWDDGNWVSSLAWNSASKVYVGASTRTDGNYTIQVRSAVPTERGYADLTRNKIKIGSLRFSNALAAADGAGCPSWYVCSGSNANPSYGRSLGSDLANNTNINGLLSFKPALEILPSKSWNDMADSTWHDVALTFKNNSTKHSFSPAKYGFDFRYDTYLGNFADMSIKGDLGTYTWLAEGNLKKISFLLSSWFSTVPSGWSVSKTIQVRANSHGLGFGKVGFTGYLPWLFENNAICDVANCSAPVSVTGYNTANLDMASGVMAFDFLSAAVPTSGFGSTQSYGQKFAANGQIADSGKNLMQTVESGIAVDSKTMDKAQFKTNIRKNVEALTASLPSDNGNNCNVTITSLAKDLYYYDFSKLSATPINGNKGCVLSIKWQSTWAASGYRKFGVTGKKTIIVRGGNVYLDTDMYYGDANSMLALVVLRDDADRTKWGNIYVNPNVTNAVGAGYAEGSLMSYDAAFPKVYEGGNAVYDAGNTNEGELTRQFLWYGSLFSSNTIGGSLTSTTSWECPYGSDTYEATKSKSCTEAEASRYDFAMLRRFILINVAASDSCYLAGSKSPKSTGTASEKFAFAGKKSCRMTDPKDVVELRSTDKTAGFVMEYNPLMQTAGMKVLSK